MTETQEIRRLPNGSINIAHYTRKGRALHGAAVRRSFLVIPGALLRFIAMPALAVHESRKSDRLPVAVAAE